MRLKHIWVDLNLFEGEGSGESGETAESAAETQTGEDEGAADPMTEEERRAAYDELIKGEYKDFYTKDTQEMINRRFAKVKNIERQLDEYRPLMDMMYQRYGANDVASAIKAMEEDNSYWEQAAFDANMSVEQYKLFSRLERENNALKEAQRQAQVDYQANQQLQAWKEQEAELQEIYPDFSLEEEIQDPEFASLLEKGIPVKHAYEVIHMDEILSAMTDYTAQQTARAVTANIRAKGSRPTENGASSKNAFVEKVDVNKMTKAERAELARRAERGEIIEL